MARSNASTGALTGSDMRRMIQGAAGWVALHREALNQINVFPVPDGDTGANLGRTLAAASQAAEQAAAEATAKEIATSAASAALMGGRGSSGVIGAQWMRGFAAGLSDDGVTDGDSDGDAGHSPRATRCPSLGTAP